MKKMICFTEVTFDEQVEKKTALPIDDIMLITEHEIDGYKYSRIVNKNFEDLFAADSVRELEEMINERASC